MPICEQVYEVLYNNKPAKEAALTLLARSPTSE
jgi:glycerol-3-phosphate dehydrogenase (NAD(P)+)